MKYISPYDQCKHNAMSGTIIDIRKKIAEEYRVIEQLQERILRIGTKEEQAGKKLKLRSAVIYIAEEE